LAKKSERLINRVGIFVNDSINLVYIKYNLHKHIHTNLYHDIVYELLLLGKNSYKKTYEILGYMKNVLRAASDATP
jgi:hypothetical protein